MLARRARRLILDGVRTDVTLGSDAADVFSDAELTVVRRRVRPGAAIEPPYDDAAMQAARRKATGTGLAHDRETILDGEATPAEYDALRERGGRWAATWSSRCRTRPTSATRPCRSSSPSARFRDPLAPGFGQQRACQSVDCDIQQAGEQADDAADDSGDTGSDEQDQYHGLEATPPPDRRDECHREQSQQERDACDTPGRNSVEDEGLRGTSTSATRLWTHRTARTNSAQR